MRPWQRAMAAMSALAIILTGCSPAYYVKSADKDAYQIINDKTQAVPDMQPDFSIETDENAIHMDSAHAMTLDQAIQTAFLNSRRFQSRKESLYKQALSLSSSRHRWETLFYGQAGSTAERNGKESSASAFGSLGLSKMLATGADLSIDVTNNLFRYISFDDPAKSAVTSVGATLTQPLWQGAGKKIATENLTQAERDMIYEIRSFVRYRRSFYISITKSYYSLLQQNDRVNNVHTNYKNLKDEYERAQLLSKAGRRPQFQVDQTRQRMLSARDSWIQAQQGYQNALDEFKITLGLPTQKELKIDQKELDVISQKGIIPVKLEEKPVIKHALIHRLDLLTMAQQVEDSKRKIDVARDQLKPGLDLKLSYNAATQERLKPVRFDDASDRYSAGLSMDLPLDKQDERNAYRSSLISYDAMQREHQEMIDTVKLEVRDALRNLDQAETRYEIQKISLKLAEGRVESTDLLQQAGRSSARDLLDARDDLLQAQNDLTATLIDHLNAKLDFYYALDELKIDPNGQWLEEESLELTK